MSNDDDLYVKLEAHQGLQEELRNVQGTMANVNEALSVLSQVREVREDAIQKVNENINHLKDSLQVLDREMPGSQQEVEPSGRVETPEIDDSVDELHSELQTLQEELQKLD